MSEHDLHRHRVIEIDPKRLLFRPRQSADRARRQTVDISCQDRAVAFAHPAVGKPIDPHRIAGHVPVEEGLPIPVIDYDLGRGIMRPPYIPGLGFRREATLDATKAAGGNDDEKAENEGPECGEGDHHIGISLDRVVGQFNSR